MRHFIFQSKDTWTGTVLRWALGIVFIPHGIQKTLGWFGGTGFKRTMDLLTGDLHLPLVIAFTVILVEFAGSFLLLLGWLTRVWALSFIGLMIGIMLTAHFENGFFMNWLGTQKGEGCQFDILAIGIALALLFEGGGKWSIDLWLFRKNNEQK